MSMDDGKENIDIVGQIWKRMASYWLLGLELLVTVILAIILVEEDRYDTGTCIFHFHALLSKVNFF